MVTWDSKRVHELLQRPQRLLQVEPWRSAVRQHGGLTALYNQLRSVPLPREQQRLLDRVLAEPGRTVAYYADTLGIHVTTYHRYWRNVIQACSIALNQADEAESPAQRTVILPTMLTSFVGREAMLGSLQTMLEYGTRLITLTGVGGAGKTRLALELARRCADHVQHGVVFVALAHVDQAERVPVAIAQTLGIKETGTQTLEQHVFEVLRDQQLLLILDNLEQISGISEWLGTLLAAAPRLSVIATSRSTVRVYGEQVVHVPPLSVPDQPHNLVTISAAEAVRLFLERARGVDPHVHFNDDHMQAIAAICQHVDGVPLAVELAAARVRVLSPQALAQRIEQSLDVLSGGARNLPTRQQSVRDLMAWSYHLLAPHEQQAFAALSVWAEGWRLNAAAHVLGYAADSLKLLDLLTGLLDSSLIVRDANAPERWRMLHLVREYAQTQLDTQADADALRLKAMHWLVELAEESVNGLKGAEQQTWLDQLDQEQTNFQAALRWLIERHHAELAVRLGGALWQYWWMRGMFSAGRQLLEQVIAMWRDVAPAVQIRAWNGAGALACSQGDYPAAQQYFERCLTIQQELDDQRGMAMTRNNIGLIAVRSEDYELAQRLFHANIAIFADQHDTYSLAATLSNLGMVARYQADYATAQDLFEQSLAARQRLGNRWGIATSQTNLAMVAVQQGHYDHALKLYRESLALLAEVGEQDSIAECFEGLAGVFWGKHEAERAALLCGAADGLRASIATPRTPIDHVWFSAISAAVREQLGAGKFDQAWADGYSQSSDAVIELVNDKHF